MGWDEMISTGLDQTYYYRLRYGIWSGARSRWGDSSISRLPLDATRGDAHALHHFGNNDEQSIYSNCYYRPSLHDWLILADTLSGIYLLSTRWKLSLRRNSFLMSHAQASRYTDFSVRSVSYNFPILSHRFFTGDMPSMLYSAEAGSEMAMAARIWH